MSAQKKLVAALLLPAVLLACSRAGSPTAATTSEGPPPASIVAPSPTTGYCGMDPEPMPCVDRPGEEPGPTTVGTVHDLAGTCLQQASGDRCQALALEAARQLGLGFDQVVAVDIVPNPSPEGIDFAHRTFLEVALVDGSVHSIVVSCPGVSGAYDPQCMHDPVVPLGFPRGPEGGGGYTDTPENATPYPSLEAAAVAGARPREIAELEVPFDHLGKTTLDLGHALLPNGYLAAAHFGLRDPWPSEVLFNGWIGLEVRPAAGGAPLWNLYEHGWMTGVEEVTATITFDVAWFKPGATITLTDIVVR